MHGFADFAVDSKRLEHNVNIGFWGSSCGRCCVLAAGACSSGSRSGAGRPSSSAGSPTRTRSISIWRWRWPRSKRPSEARRDRGSQAKGGDPCCAGFSRDQPGGPAEAAAFVGNGEPDRQRRTASPGAEADFRLSNLATGRPTAQAGAVEPGRDPGRPDRPGDICGPICNAMRGERNLNHGARQSKRNGTSERPCR